MQLRLTTGIQEIKEINCETENFSIFLFRRYWVVIYTFGMIFFPKFHCQVVGRADFRPTVSSLVYM
jgi:hypothetical protein